MSITLTITPDCKLDQIWDFRIENLSSIKSDEITIEAKMQDLFGNFWRSYATFKNDISNNTIDLKSAAPIKGSYSGIDPMGLIWSMECDGVHGLLARRFDLSPCQIDITIKDSEDNILIQQTVTRKVIASDVDKIVIREKGLVGTLYTPLNITNKKLPAVIMLSGSEGGFRDEQAARLAEEGYVTFALSYFIYDQTPYNDLPLNFPTTIKNIPLEYFEQAIQFLQLQPNIDPDRIGIIGTSRGGELALLLGVYFSKIKCVIAYVPNFAVQAAFGPSEHLEDETEPSWTYQGKPISCLPLVVKNVDWFGDNPVVLKDGFILHPDKMPTKSALNFNEAIIPVEKINGPVLLISAGNDLMWPSKAMAELIMQRLEEKQYPHLSNSKHLHYPKAGHLIMVPWWPTTGGHAVHPVDKVDYAFGGTAEADAHAGYESWQHIKQFLHNNLAPKIS